MMIKTGLDVLIQEKLALFDHQRVGLVSHPAAVNADLLDSTTCLLQAGVKVSALFGPEHGFYGMAADGVSVGNSVDARTGLPVFSLYGRTKEPTAEMLKGLDALLFDMQDVGVRFYTYLCTLLNVMKGAARAGIPVIILDRPNPITGTLREGPLLQPGFESFVGCLPIPIRHGMTLGELALYANPNIQCALTVIPMQGWDRNWWFDEFNVNWIPTSPGIPHFETTLYYPGTCLVEGTNLSEGRGTALPFQVVGAPWVDGHTLAESLNANHIPGVYFRPTAFIPSASKHAGAHCQGVQLHITDREAFNPLTTGLHLAAACGKLFADQFKFLPSSWEGQPSHFDLLMGSDKPRKRILSGEKVDNIVQDWDEHIFQFNSQIQPFLLY